MVGRTVLSCDSLRLVVDPEHGASIVSFDAIRGGEVLPVMPDSSKASCDLDSACFLMIPYSNRIRDGRFTFHGREHLLSRGEEHSLHGDVRFRPWRVISGDSATITLLYDSNEAANSNWPWSFSSRVTYHLKGSSTLGGGVLRGEMEVTNTGEDPMPAGFGFHPYFSRHLTSQDEEVRLCFEATAIYPDERQDRMPSGSPCPIPGAFDFSKARNFQRDQFMDSCFRGFKGVGLIQWPRSGVSVSISCTDLFSHLVIYNPGDKPYFAFEPVTNANDGINLFGRGDMGAGVIVLEPGASATGCLELTVEI